MRERFDTNIIVFINNASLGKNNYWISFDAYVSSFNPSKRYKMDYCGTKLHSSIPFTAEKSEVMRGMLIDDYAYGPFDINRVRTILGSGKSYVFKKPII